MFTDTIGGDVTEYFAKCSYSLKNDIDTARVFTESKKVTKLAIAESWIAYNLILRGLDKTYLLGKAQLSEKFLSD